MEDIVCICGHPQIKHINFVSTSTPLDLVCMVAGQDTSIDDCECWNYIPDNLSHIEQLAKRKGLI